jgi:hypothetical protein
MENWNEQNLRLVEELRKWNDREKQKCLSRLKEIENERMSYETKRRGLAWVIVMGLVIGFIWYALF